MKASQLKELLIRSLDPDADPEEASRKLLKASGNFKFSGNFVEEVLDAISGETSVGISGAELEEDISTIFYRIAVTGFAAIILLLISIFLTEGSLSLNSFLGIINNHDESIICLLTGK